MNDVSFTIRNEELGIESLNSKPSTVNCQLSIVNCQKL